MSQSLSVGAVLILATVRQAYRGEGGCTFDTVEAELRRWGSEAYAEARYGLFEALRAADDLTLVQVLYDEMRVLETCGQVFEDALV